MSQTVVSGLIENISEIVPGLYLNNLGVVSYANVFNRDRVTVHTAHRSRNVDPDRVDNPISLEDQGPAPVVLFYRDAAERSPVVAPRVERCCPYTGPPSGPLSIEPSAVLLPTGTVWV
jgi:hypothetical protein